MMILGLCASNGKFRLYAENNLNDILNAISLDQKFYLCYGLNHHNSFSWFIAKNVSSTSETIVLFNYHFLTRYTIIIFGLIY